MPFFSGKWEKSVDSSHSFNLARPPTFSGCSSRKPCCAFDLNGKLRLRQIELRHSPDVQRIGHAKRDAHDEVEVRGSQVGTRQIGQGNGARYAIAYEGGAVN